jgi:hypothetical protein
VQGWSIQPLPITTAACWRDVDGKNIGNAKRLAISLLRKRQIRGCCVKRYKPRDDLD